MQIIHSNNSNHSSVTQANILHRHYQDNQKPSPELVSWEHSSIGKFPKTTWIVTFHYDDGTIKSFDGSDWK